MSKIPNKYARVLLDLMYKHGADIWADIFKEDDFPSIPAQSTPREVLDMLNDFISDIPEQTANQQEVALIEALKEFSNIYLTKEDKPLGDVTTLEESQIDPEFLEPAQTDQVVNTDMEEFNKIKLLDDLLEEVGLDPSDIEGLSPDEIIKLISDSVHAIQQPEIQQPQQPEIHAIQQPELDELDDAIHAIQPPVSVNVINNSSINKQKEKLDDTVHAVQEEIPEQSGGQSEPFIPTKFPFVMGNYGQKFSGKSNFLKVFLELYMDNFDRIILISSTAKINKEYNKLKEVHPAFDIFNKISEEDLAFLNNSKSANLEKDWLIIFDDFIGIFNPHKSNEFAKMVTSARQLNISLIMNSQKYTKTPPVFRDNQEVMVLFKMSNAEYSKVWSEFRPSLPKKKFLQLAHSIINKKGKALAYDAWRSFTGQWLELFVSEYGKGEPRIDIVQVVHDDRSEIQSK